MVNHDLDDNQKLEVIHATIYNDDDAWNTLTDWEIDFVSRNTELQRTTDVEWSVKQSQTIDEVYEKLWKGGFLNG